MDIQAVRAEIAVTRTLAYLQTGSIGPAPRTAVRSAQQDLEELNSNGPAHLPSLVRLLDRVEEARSALARVLGCQSSELGFTQNTSQSINMVALSRQWQPGEEVILTNLEHPANVIPWHLLEERCGLRVRIVDAEEPERLPERIAAAISPQTRLISICHVSPLTGAVLPVAAVCAEARRRGVPTLVDGAQAAGVMPVNLEAMECDYYVGSGHKWLLGLPGIGYLYVRSEALSTYHPLWIGPGSAEYASGRINWSRDARKIEFGTRDMATIASLRESLSFLESVGFAGIFERVGKLARYLRDQLVRIPGLRLLTPLGPYGASGLTTFRLEDGQYEELIAYLLDKHRVLAKVTVPTRDSVRVSTHFFNEEHEIDRFVVGLREFMRLRG